jgi:hypothetical protein
LIILAPRRVIKEPPVIKKRGNRWWVVVYAGRDPLTGRKRQKTGTAATKAEARQLEARLISQVGTGQHGGAAGKTVADLIEAWFQWRPSVRPISPNTLVNYRRMRDGQPPMRPGEVFRLRFSGEERVHQTDCVQGIPMTPSAIRDVHAVLSGAFKQAMVWGWISHNPVPLTTPPAVEPPDTRPPEVGQAERLIETAMAEDPELGLFLVLAVVLGARRGELCSLRWSDVDFDQGDVLVAGAVIILPGQPPLDRDDQDPDQAPGRGRPRYAGAAARAAGRAGQGGAGRRRRTGPGCLRPQPRAGRLQAHPSR